MQSLPSTAEDRVRRAKRRVVLDLFLQRGEVWNHIREMRERWEIDAQPQMPPPYPNVLAPEVLGPPPEEQFGDEAEQWHAKYREWASDLARLFEAVVPEAARDTKYFFIGSSFWGRFLPMCVLYDPPETQLEDFAESIGGLASNVWPSGEKQYWMPAPPIVWLRDADRAESTMRESYEALLEAVLERYVHPQGISSEDALESIHREKPELFVRLIQGLKDNESRPYIDVRPYHQEPDVISAFKVLAARHDTRPRQGRPPRDDLTAVQCAILYDRHNAADPTDKRQRTWTYERLAEEFSLDSSRAATVSERREIRCTAGYNIPVLYSFSLGEGAFTMDVTLAVLADYANVSQDGKLNILGVFQEVSPVGFPAAVPQMFLVVSFEAGAAEFGTQKNIRIALLEADGTEVMAMEGPIVVQNPPRPGSRAFINQILSLQGLTFQKSGDYAFHILVNGDEKRAVPLRVNDLPNESNEGGTDG